MKIIVVGTRGFPNVQGGVEKHCEKLYTYLAESGCNIIVFTRKPYTPANLKEFKGVKLIPVSCPRNKFIEAIVHTFICVVKAKKLHPDVLHIHGIGPSLFTPLARVMGMKVIVTNHGPEYKRKKWSYPAKLFLRCCEWFGMTFANGIIAISHIIADDIKNKFKREAVVLPNGVDVSERTDEGGTINKFGLKKMKFILAVGRFVPEKGFHDLIEAFVSSGLKEFKLVIAGEADHEDTYSRNLKTKARGDKNIVLTGYLSEESLRELYSSAALFVIPSYYEGLPIALLEAMSFGVSCIASDIPSNRNVPLDKARYFWAGNVKSITARINEFIRKEWDEKDRTQQINMIDERYNWRKIADETFKVYKNVVS